MDLESASAQRLDTLIDRRAGERSKANELEAMYAESVRRHNERKRQANRLAWLDYHRGQAERLRAALEVLVSRHEEAAEKLLETLAPSELEEGESWVSSRRP